jgi:hypothetical protein
LKSGVTGVCQSFQTCFGESLTSLASCELSSSFIFLYFEVLTTNILLSPYNLKLVLSFQSLMGVSMVHFFGVSLLMLIISTIFEQTPPRAGDPNARPSVGYRSGGGNGGNSVSISNFSKASSVHTTHFLLYTCEKSATDQIYSLPLKGGGGPGPGGPRKRMAGIGDLNKGAICQPGEPSLLPSLLAQCRISNAFCNPPLLNQRGWLRLRNRSFFV